MLRVVICGNTWRVCQVSGVRAESLYDAERVISVHTAVHTRGYFGVGSPHLGYGRAGRRRKLGEIRCDMGTAQGALADRKRARRLAGQGRAGQGRAGQGRAGQGRAGRRLDPAAGYLSVERAVFSRGGQDGRMGRHAAL